MANRKFHTHFNLLCLFVALLFLAALPAPETLSFCSGWFIATFFLSPDSDLLPAKRLGPFRPFFYPYSLMFKHRGHSHSYFLGTLTRILYLYILSIIFIYILVEMGHISRPVKFFIIWPYEYLLGFNYDELSYRLFLWAFLGLWGADFSHIFIDRLTSFIKRILRSLNPFK